MLKSTACCALLVGSLISFPAQAKMYKWVDAKGVTHYGETIPPEYADRDRAELSKAGRIVNTQDVLTPDERRAKEAADAKSKAAADTVREQKLHDSSLLNTYSNPQEIDLAKNRNLQQLDARAQIASKQLNDAKQSLANVQQSVDARHKAGNPVPPFMQDELQASQNKVDKLSKELNAINTEKAALEARYDNDKARYKELTGK